MKISIVLMASGFGKRYGSNKLLEHFQGKPLYAYAIDTAAESGADSISVVTRFPEISHYIEANYPGGRIRVIPNLHPERGISESLRLGLMAERDADGCCFMVCDQPLLKKETLHKMFRSFSQRKNRIYLCSDGSRRGNPVLFPKEFFSELLSLQGDRGGKQVIKKHPDKIQEIPVESREELWDIDSAEDKKILHTAAESKE